MKQEQIQRTRRKRSVDQVLGTFPERDGAQAHGGDGESGVEELMERIEKVLRALGGSSGIEVA